MYEREVGIEAVESIASTMRGIQDVCVAQSIAPTNEDPRIAAFSEAFGLSLQENPDVYNAAVAMVKARDINPEDAFNLWLRGIQYLLLMHRIPLEGFTDRRQWIDALAHAADPESKDHEYFMRIILEFNIRSTKLQRYISSALISELASERLGEDIVNVDGGSSEPIGIKKLTLGRILPFSFKEVSVTNAGIELPKTAVDWPEDYVVSPRTNWVIQRSKPIKHGLGIDRAEVNTPEDRLYVAACSFYPSNLINLREPKTPAGTWDTPYEEEDLTAFHRNIEFMEHKMLEIIDAPNVDFYHADFTRINPEDIIQKLPEGKRPQLVTIYTVMNQLTPAEQQKVLKNALELVDPDGLILVKDFASVDPDHNDRLIINHAGPRMIGEYKLYMFDPGKPHEGYIHLITYATGRCLQMQFQPAITQFPKAVDLGLYRP